MASSRNHPDKGKGMSKQISQPEHIEPSVEVPEVAFKSASAKKSLRKSTREGSKVVSESRLPKKKSAKKEKQKKVKMIRDSFNMPESDYAKIAELKQKCLAAGVHVKKSELLRLGLTHLSILSKANLLRSVKQIERIKTGRPVKPRENRG